ncbi:mechanosensitive ion channel [Aureisphaera galaxeae]|uniref:mechanosensitive ion channel family protein n=1 Tax=Aureisphaera galaxeae TaxID=1538023 RepID=UPI002350A8D5|nr:mechanosensitive ion channel domain-containing protein [Aureisphaera galaxeae]MDC8004364.1 mechanosensitive ion channel [Aureisphaera galaxeae]
MNRESLATYFDWLNTYFVDAGMNPALALALSTIINCILVAAIVTLLDILVRKTIVTGFRIFSSKTRTTYDNYLVKSNFPRFVAHFIPVGVIWYVEPLLFKGYPPISEFLLIAIDVYIVILSVLVFRSILRTTTNYLKTKEEYRDKPLESYVQVLMIFAWGIGLFLIISRLTGYEIKSLLTLGAASAALLLIFRDTILGFVASIQVTVNDIVRIGDWITFSKYGADGYVTEINLATVRVQNFDNTYTTIPTYSLTSDSFQNWRGMQESGGRRIKRSLFIKQGSVKFLTEAQIAELSKIELITEYLSEKQTEIDSHNSDKNADKSLPINGRNQTNLGVFRIYVENYLNTLSGINKDMFLMVRHLSPTTEGIPMEVYCFSKSKEWQDYEKIMAHIFDHLIAATPYFQLELFEKPTSTDLVSLKKN